MKLQNLTLKEFLEKTASSEALPGGGCSIALMAAIATSLTEMVANLTIGREKYIGVEKRMKEIVEIMSKNRAYFLNDIDRDVIAYRQMMDSYRMPKNTEEEITLRNQKIQQTTKIATVVPMELAQRAHGMLDIINETLQKGNVNVVPDGEVGLIACKAAIKGALLNVSVNLKNIDDDEFVVCIKEKCKEIEDNI